MKSAVLTSGLVATALLLVVACGPRQVGFKADVEALCRFQWKLTSQQT